MAAMESPYVVIMPTNCCGSTPVAFAHPDSEARGVLFDFTPVGSDDHVTIAIGSGAQFVLTMNAIRRDEAHGSTAAAGQARRGTHTQAPRHPRVQQ